MLLTSRQLEHFSPNEQSIIDILGKNTMRLNEIADVLYSGIRKPAHASSVVSNAIIRINNKCKEHDINLRIKVIGNQGRNGKTVKLTKRTSSIPHQI